MMAQLGGVAGIIYSSVPVLVFVGTSRLLGLPAASGAALGVATLILLWRLVRRESVQPAVSGLIGVGVCVLIAYLLGQSKGYFLLGIWTSLLYAAVFAVSIVIRRPVVGYIWSWLHGHDRGWRNVRRAVYAFDVATLTWVVVFGARSARGVGDVPGDPDGAARPGRCGGRWLGGPCRHGSRCWRSSSSASVIATNNSSSPPSSGSSSCGTITRGPRRIVTSATSRGSCSLRTGLPPQGVLSGRVISTRLA
jgi:hypothetical protein